MQDFYTIVLDELVLEVAMRYRNDAPAEPLENNYNKVRRHAAYRQSVMWMHGRRWKPKSDSKLLCFEDTEQISRAIRPICRLP